VITSGLPSAFDCLREQDEDTFCDDDIITLTGASAFDLEALLAAVEPLGFELHIGRRFELVESELKRLVAEKGVSYVWQVVRLQEAVLARTQNVPAIVTLLAAMLSRLAPTQDFVIVDRFLLTKSKSSDYLRTLVSLIEPICRAVCQLIIVTGRNYDPQLLTDLIAQASPPGSNCLITHQISDTFHDRFWIADRQRGLFIGTSLNGIGLRYALADYLHENDVRDVVTALVSERLL
jgi:hypothetical protein